MTTEKALTGLDALVAEAMGRKIVDVPQPPKADSDGEPSGDGSSVAAPEQPAETKPTPAVDTSKAPPISIPFAVNGVKCVLTIHVEAGAVVTTPQTPKTAPSSPGVTVKGIRGQDDETEAQKASEAEADTAWKKGWVAGGTKVNEPFPHDVVYWRCPEHDQAEKKTSKVTGRDYIVCPECGKLAPKEMTR